jgi:phospholipid/cholesterol/gamma-HCH transport system substrate-binding protein
VKGFVAVAIVGAAVFVAVKAAHGGFGHYYELVVDLPRAGQQLEVGSDVRMRGVVVGHVDRIDLLDRKVRVMLKLDQRYRVPSTTDAVVSLKTLLGAKFVDLRFPTYAGPFLADGARIRSAQVGPELEDALQDGVHVLDAIRPQDAATVVHELAVGALGHGKDIARGLQANEQLSGLFAQTLQPQLQSLHDFTVIFGQLQSKGVDLNNLADAVNQGVPVYASARAHQDLRAALSSLTPFANDLADLFIYNRADWDRMIGAGDVVLGTIAARQQGLASLIQGVFRYVFKLSAPPFALDNGTGAAGFVNFMGGDNSNQNRQQFCDALPPNIRANAPLCMVGP